MRWQSISESKAGKMYRVKLWTFVVALCALGIAGCGSGSELRIAITTAPATLAARTASNVVATVTHDSAGGGVNWSCMPAGSCGTFHPTQTPSGMPSAFTAPPAAPSGGSVTIIATSVANPSRSASVTVAITAVLTQNFVFYASGEENASPNFPVYSIAGVVAIAQIASADGSFAVVSGEQDYNDGVAITSPQPAGDSITGGSLAVAADGVGTLTLITNNSQLGNAGTETFAVSFPNPKHALVTQFDGTATSSGSLDLQTSTSTPSGSFSFVFSGVGEAAQGFFPAAFGGVFTVTDGTLVGTLDTNFGGVLGSNLPGTVSLNNPLSASLSTPDSFGRGSINSTAALPTALNYYVLGAQVIRIIDVNSLSHDTAVGSAYGQGAVPGFSLGSIGNSVFSVQNAFDSYAAVGEFIPGAGSFSGVGDLNELLGAGTQLMAQPISGSYTLASDGYGSMTFNGGFADIAKFGIYAVDPTLNILDPNGPATDGGGALVAEMDASLVGTGSLVPQNRIISSSDFAGFYVFGGQGVTNRDGFFEFDFVGTGIITEPGGAFLGQGDLSDPFGALSGNQTNYTNVAFTASAVPDTLNPGRYTFNPFTLSNAGFASDITLNVAAYQASGEQLFWIEVDPGSYFSGSLEQGAAPSASARAKPKNQKQ
jgi:hypothetical protein